MPVPVVDVRVMRVLVRQRLVAVRVGMRLAAVIGEIVRVAVMLVALGIIFVSLLPAVVEFLKERKRRAASRA